MAVLWVVMMLVWLVALGFGVWWRQAILGPAYALVIDCLTL